MILDTNAVSALLAGDPELAALLRREVRHHLPVIVIGEYRYGLIRSKQRRRLGSLLDTLVSESIVLQVTRTTARIYADVREQLRIAKRPIPENDIWIAALSLQHRQPVVSRDRDFDQVAGLTRLGW